MPVSACYTMDLYCQFSTFGPDNSRASSYEDDMKLHAHDEFPHQFTAETWGQCKRKAQNKGWIFHKNREVTCPKCAPTNTDAKP